MSEQHSDVGPGEQSPHVVMIVGNDVATDNRVLKSAATLSRAGLRVTILGNSLTETRTDSRMGDVRILRVPVELTLRDARRKKRGRRRQRRLLLLGWGSKTETAASRLRPLARLRESDGGSLARRRERVDTFVMRARAAGQRKIDGAVKLGWRVWDKAWSYNTVLVRWRAVAPELRDFELAFGPVIDTLGADVVHAHDYHMVNVAALASRRAAREGRALPWVYDAHEFVPGMAAYGGKTPRLVAAYAKAEHEYVRDASAVVTVSPFIVDALERKHRLRERPVLVLNAPAWHGKPDSGPDVRSATGLASDVPLLVYSGGVTPVRGVDTLVRSLVHLPDVHLAIVCVPSTKGQTVERLKELAAAIGVRSRVHLLDPVGPAHVTAFLRSADVGVHPLRGGIPNHDMALPNKLFEYLQAGLPLVVSDAKALADFVAEHGVGASFTTDDDVSCAAAIRTVLDDRDRFAAAVAAESAAYTWQGQEEPLVGVYRRLLGLPLPLAEAPFELAPVQAAGRRHDGIVLGIGPANSAGQGWAWGRAVERNVPGVRAEVLAVEKETWDYPCDVAVPVADFARGRAWQLAWSTHVTGEWTHALLEAGRGIMGTLNGRNFVGDTRVLRAAGITVGLVFHGSEIRDPRRHATTTKWSPFRDAGDPLTARLQRKYDELAPAVASFDGPTFVSTPDLHDYVPGAHWLPLVVDTTVWTPQAEPPMQRQRPVVVHAPSHTTLKGTEYVESVLQPLHDRGIVEYRRLQNIPPSQIRPFLADCDILIDQLRAGGYGVLACEGAALGKVVMGYIGETVMSRIPGEVPLVDVEPDTLEAVLLGLLEDRERAQAIAAAGPGFVARWHDGREAARVLQENLLAVRT